MYVAELHRRPDWGSLSPGPTHPPHLAAAGVPAGPGWGLALTLRWIWIPLGEKGNVWMSVESHRMLSSWGSRENFFRGIM